MKTLIINGSPRRQGGTSAIVGRLSEQLSGDIAVIEVYYANVSPCTDCRYCWQHPVCAIPDAMQEMYRMIDMADNLVIASPIYFAELTGPHLSWASRLQFFYASRRFRGEQVLTEKQRHGAVVLVDGGDGIYQTAEAMGRRLLRTMGAAYESLIYYSGTDYLGGSNPLDDAETVRKIAELAERWNGNTENE